MFMSESNRILVLVMNAYRRGTTSGHRDCISVDFNDDRVHTCVGIPRYTFASTDVNLPALIATNTCQQVGAIALEVKGIAVERGKVYVTVRHTPLLFH